MGALQMESLEMEKQEFITNFATEHVDLDLSLETELNKNRINELESIVKTSKEKICSLQKSMIDMDKLNEDIVFLQDSLSNLEKKSQEEKEKYDRHLSDYENRLKALNQDLKEQKEQKAAISEEREEMKKTIKSQAEL